MTTRPLTLLHLSDTQFGRHHRFGNLNSADPDESFDTLLSRISDDLQALRQGFELTPQAVLLTGDLAEWGKPAEFEEALKFAIGLSEKLAIPRRHFVIIPGNHD
jgi:3',5'-cyclic AMP phosphodiesterase CpdA